MKIQYSPYSLVKKTKVNAQDKTATHEGTLLRVIDEEGNWGVADLCPWPTLGDLTLKQEVSQKGILHARAVELAIEDLEARRQKKSLLQDKWVENNILVTDYKTFNFEDPRFQGKTLKIKVDADWKSEECEKLALIFERVYDGLKIRLDFNNNKPRSSAAFFFDLANYTRNIEYIEDPQAYNELVWKRWNEKIPLAIDFVKAPENYTYKIWKPVREPKPQDLKFTITSSMDHPVGVAHALRYAQNFAQNASGLLTLDLYQPTDFHHHFIYRNESEMNFSPETLKDLGIGMTAELNRLNWKNSL